jgi:hypothetical protein
MTNAAPINSAWVFALAPGVQFDLVGGDVADLPQGDVDELFDAARLVASNSGSSGATVGAAVWLRGADQHVVLVGFHAPGVLERATGRGGLSVTIGCGLARTVAVESIELVPGLVVMLCSALGRAIVGRGDCDSAQLAQTLASAVQDGDAEKLSAIADSARDVSRIAGALSAWSQPRSRLRARPERVVSVQGGGEASWLELCRLLARQLLAGERECYGGHLSLSSPADLLSGVGPRTSAVGIVHDGIVVAGDSAWFADTFGPR